MKPATKYCAVYTRKSTEEGLEQDFNTLDAQREGCLAYITSQKAEGWVAVKDHYDDGGFSGGNMERPALKKLLEDIKAGKIHTIVVYKIDRLTRSLMDFAKLVEIFDQYNVTFVSITQSFNTTTSMGRLTLNVLLSFAQFEREVIGERVWDKIAASKKKGMWMGGNPPIGYDVENRQLVVNRDGAKVARHIFERYLALGTVHRLKTELDREGYLSKNRISESGKESGGKKFTRGALYSILSNPIYIGRIRHRDKTYEGLHEGVISLDIWNEVQERLQLQSAKQRGRKQARDINLLKGLLFDCDGTAYTPSFTAKGSKQYRYYISQNLVQYRDHPREVLTRLPAHEIESAVESTFREHLVSGKKLASIIGINAEQHSAVLKHIGDLQSEISFEEFVSGAIHKVTVDVDTLTIEIKNSGLINLLSENLRINLPLPARGETKSISVPYTTRRARKGALVIEPEKAGREIFDLPADELKKLIQGFVWREEHFSGKTIRQISQREGLSDSHVGKQIFQTFAVL